MPDVCELVLDQHHEMRVRFADLDLLHADPPMGARALAQTWGSLHHLLIAHAEAEELLFYPLLARLGSCAGEGITDAVAGHNEIRGAGRDTEEHRPGSAAWWSSVSRVRLHNSIHMAEEERALLPELRLSASAEAREEAGARWEAFMTTRLRDLAGRISDDVVRWRPNARTAS